MKATLQRGKIGTKGIKTTLRLSRWLENDILRDA